MYKQLPSQSFQNKKRESIDIIINKGLVETRQRGQKPQIQRSTDKTWYYLGLFGEIGFSIAIPIVGGAFLGRYIDDRLSTYPRATLILLLGGVVLSFVVLFQTVRNIIEKAKKD